MRSYLVFRLRAWGRVRSEKPDVVDFSDIYAYPYRSRGLADRDGHVCADNPAPTRHRTGRCGFFRVLRVFRRWFARKADIRINPQPERAKLFEDATGCGAVMVVHNCPSLTEIRAMPAFGDKPAGLILWHHGSLGPGRLPLTIVEAVAQCRDDVVLRVAGYETLSTKGFVASLQARANELDIGHRVIYHGPMNRDALYAAASEAHLGLSVFDQKLVEPMVGASKNPFDFLGCTMALMVNVTAEWQGFIVARDVAVACDLDDAENIARVLNRLYEDRAALRALAKRGRRMIDTEWNHEAQFQPVLEAIEGRFKRGAG